MQLHEIARAGEILAHVRIVLTGAFPHATKYINEIEKINALVNAINVPERPPMDFGLRWPRPGLIEVYVQMTFKHENELGLDILQVVYNLAEGTWDVQIETKYCKSLNSPILKLCSYFDWLQGAAKLAPPQTIRIEEIEATELFRRLSHHVFG